MVGEALPASGEQIWQALLPYIDRVDGQLLLRLGDDTGSRSVRLVNASGNPVLYLDSDGVVRGVDDLELESGTGGDIKLTSAAGDIHLTAAAGEIVAAAEDINVVATAGDLLLEATAGDIKGTLGDAVGAKGFYLLDSGDNPVLQVDSDGHVLVSTGIGALAYRNATQSIPNGTWTTLQQNTQSSDTEPDNMFIPTSGLMYARRPGWYMWGGSFEMASTSNSAIILAYQLDGATGVWGAADAGRATNGKAWHKSVAVLGWFETGEYSSIYCWHDKGSAQNTRAASNSYRQRNCHWMVRIV